MRHWFRITLDVLLTHKFYTFAGMENYLLLEKKFEIKKNEDYTFRIPTLLNVKETTFFIKFSDGEFKKNTLIELILKNTKTGDLDNKAVRITKELENPVIQFTLRHEELLMGNDYLLIGCKANQTVKLELSVRKDA